MVLVLRTLLLLGCLQGTVSCILLFRTKARRQANRLLGLLILLISLATLKIYGNAEGWWDQGLIQILIANFVPFFLIMPIGPLAYFYIRSSVEPGFVLGKRERIHFYPVVLDLVPVAAAFIYIIFAALGWARQGPRAWGDFIDTYNVYVDIPRWVSVTVYLWAAWRVLARERAGAGQSAAAGCAGAGAGRTAADVAAGAANTGRKGNAGAEGDSPARWLRQFVLAFLLFQGTWLLYLIPYVLPVSGDWVLDHLGWYPLYIPLTVLSYWLGIRGYLFSQLFPVTKEKALPAEMVQKTAQVIRRAMTEDRVYRNPNLNLAQLAKHTGIPAKTLSTVLNQHFRKSFTQFVNEYRVREVQERLREGDAREKTIAGLAYDCGFNSLPTFQRAFKSVCGVSPTEFLLRTGIE